MTNWLFDPNKCPPHNAEAPVTSFVNDPTVPDAPDLSSFDVPDLASNFPNVDVDAPAFFPTNPCAFLVVHCVTKQKQLVDGDLAQHVTEVVTFDKLPGCWHVVGQACQLGAQPIQVQVTGSHPNCAQCGNCFDLKHCDGPETLVARGNLANHVGKVVRLSNEQPEKCWEVRRGDTCQGAKPVQVGVSYRNCDNCVIYELESCDDPNLVVYTPADLAEASGKTPQELINNPLVFVFDILPGCWIPTNFGKDIAPPEDFLWLEIVDVLDSCNECTCYILTDCFDREQRYLAVNLTLPDGSFANMDDYVGRVVRLSDGGCYEVSRVDEYECGKGLPKKKDVWISTDHDECEHCRILRMVQCGDTSGTVVPVFSDVSRLGPPRLGAVFMEEDGTCWQITSFGGDYSTAAAKNFIAYIGDNNCDDCGGIYQLRDACKPDWCQSSNNAVNSDLVVSDATLVQAVGKYVNIAGKCYYVEGPVSAAPDVTDPDWEAFESCEDCLGTAINTVTLLASVCTSSGTQKLVPVTLRGNFEVCYGDCVDVAECGAECGSGTSGGGGGGSGGGGSTQGDWCTGCDKWPDSFTVSFSADPPCDCMSGEVSVTRDGPGASTWSGTLSKACATVGVDLVVTVTCDQLADAQVNVQCDVMGAPMMEYGCSIDIRCDRPFGGSCAGTSVGSGDNGCCSDATAFGFVIEIR